MGRARMRWAAALAAACALGAAPAHAAPTDVRLRVEGRSATLYEGVLRTTAAPVDGGDGSGAHDCNAGASPASALAASGLSWTGTWNRDFRDFFLDRVAGDASDPHTVSYWSVLVDWRYVAGVCRAVVPAGGEVLLTYGSASRVLRLDGPARADVGRPFAVTVRDGWLRADTGADGGPVAGASVGGVTTGDDGRATVRFDAPGVKRLKATAPDAARSNALDVCVGDERCEGALPPPRPPAPAPPPETMRVAITVPPAGERYASGGSTLRLRGTASGTVAVTLAGRLRERCVEPAPERRLAGWSCGRGPAGRCVELDRGGRLATRPCGRAPAAVAAAPAQGVWTLTLRRRLPPGAYRMTATAGQRTATRRFTVASVPATARDGVRRGGRWLRSHGSSSPLFHDWAAIALGRLAPGSRAYRRALAAVTEVRRSDLASLERAALALAPARARHHRAQRRRIQAAIARRQHAGGCWATGVDATAYAVLALRGGRHAAAVRRGRAWLRAHAPAAVGADTAGAALWALGSRAPRSLVDRLRSLQNPDGGFAARSGDPSNAQSTALAVVGLGARAASVRADTGISGVDYLRARQRPSGRVDYALGDRRTPVWATAQALLGLARAGGKTGRPRSRGSVLRRKRPSL